MKKIGMMLVGFAVILILFSSLVAQTVGDYRTRSNGTWSNSQVWERFNGASWLAITTPPTGTETITIRSSDSVFVSAPVSITGKLVYQGKLEAVDSLTFVIGNGGVFQYDRDGGSMPPAVWEEGSTLLMTGITSTAPTDRDQDYYNVTFDTPGLLSNLNMNLNGNTIGGDIKVINTGSARWYLTTAVAQDTSIITIMGDVIVEAGALSVQGTSNAQTTFIVHHYGNIIVTGGNFSIARGSQANGTTTWYLYEGNFSMSNATTQSSTNPPGNARFVFCKGATQTLTLGEGNTLTRLPIEVSAGTTLDMGSSTLAGTGNFTLHEGATLLTTLTGGIGAIFSAVDAAAVITLAEGSGYGFNAIAAQITSSRMPAIVSDLFIDNPAGVMLSQATTINGVLHLMAGEFDNTIPFTLGPNGSISYEGGSLKIPVSVALNEPNIPRAFFVEQNYPNPFNPTTAIKFGLPAASQVRITIFNMLGQEVATLLDKRMDAGVHLLQFDLNNLSTGIYVFRIQAGEWIELKRMALVK